MAQVTTHIGMHRVGRDAMMAWDARHVGQHQFRRLAHQREPLGAVGQDTLALVQAVEHAQAVDRSVVREWCAFGQRAAAQLREPPILAFSNL